MHAVHIEGRYGCKGRDLHFGRVEQSALKLRIVSSRTPPVVVLLMDEVVLLQRKKSE
jgi:hypothetical protein